MAGDLPYATRVSTADVSPRDAFAYWREMICQTFVQLDAEPGGHAPFSGGIEHTVVGQVEMSSVVAGAQRVRRTRSLIARGNEEYLLASIQIRGAGRVEQDGHSALLGPGDLAFYDSSRPYVLHFDHAFEQLVVQVPRGLLLADERPSSDVTGRLVPAVGMGRVIGGFFRALAHTSGDNPSAARLALPHAVGLLGAAVSAASGTRPQGDSLAAMSRQRILAYMRQHLGEPSLDAEAIALGCAMSRRSLYRVLGDETGGVAATLRRLRVEHAQYLLVTEPRRPIQSIATACGFESESAFYRAFRALTGHTPGESRQ